MKYFRLFPDCIYNCGVSGGIVFFLAENSIIRLSKIENDILDYALHTGSYEDVIGVYGDLADRLIEKLIDHNMGTFYTQPVYIDYYKPKCDWEMRGYLEQPPDIKQMYLGVTGECDLNCAMCGGNYLVSNSCRSCVKWGEQGNNRIMWDLEYLTALMKFQPEEIIISGGNPLREWREVKKIVTRIHAINKYQRIKVNTNVIALEKNIIEESKNLGICFELTLLDWGNVCGSTKEKMYADKESENIAYCKKNGIEYSICFLVDNPSKTIQKHISHMRKDNNNISVAECFKRGSRANRLIYTPRNINKLHIDQDAYFENQRFNPCLKDKLSIDGIGNIYTCPFTGVKLGNIIEEGVKAPFRNGKLDSQVRSTKKNVDKCKECEYQNFCQDCIVLEKAIQEGMLNEDIFCSYKVENGTWEKEGAV